MVMTVMLSGHAFTIGSLLLIFRVVLFADSFSTFVSSMREEKLPKATLGMTWQTLHVDSFSDSPVTDGSTRTRGHPQTYKDEAYRDAVLTAWKSEAERIVLWEDFQVETKSIVYYCDEDKIEESARGATDGGTASKAATPLFGQIIRRKLNAKRDALPQGENGHLLPGILLFHTGAGPHDLFLQWKAQSLVCSKRFSSGCIVLIADILSDGIGWAWDADRSRFGEVYSSVIAMDNDCDPKGERPELQRRASAAYNTLCSLPHVDSSKIAALGWCLGGHPIFEIAKSPRKMFSGMKAMITFHGVFGPVRQFHSSSSPANARDLSEEVRVSEASSNSSILICNGDNDPFVDSADLEASVELFRLCGHHVDVLHLPGARHGFTNPAQDFNENESFKYHGKSADVAWEKALDLLNKSVG